MDGKGRHPTSHRELLLLPGGGVIIDTPGLWGVALHAADAGLSLALSDVEDLATACRFADCGHVSEPGCAVLANVVAGEPRTGPRRLLAHAAARASLPGPAHGRPAPC